MAKKRTRSLNTAGGKTDPLAQARIISIANKQAQVLIGADTATCMLPKSVMGEKNALLVGDRVNIEALGNEQYRLCDILPRETVVHRGSRRNPGEEIPIAANAQVLLIVITANYLMHQAGYPESGIIAAQRAGLEVGIFVSKSDLAGESAQAILEQKLAPYQSSANFALIGTESEQFDEVMGSLTGKTIVVVGDRSSGKTSLVRKILGDNSKLQSQQLPSTHTSVLQVGSNDTIVIDTPGFRDFALSNITAPERDEAFGEIAEMDETCYFSDCSHTHEEGCSIIEAVRQGKIGRERYEAYRSMSGEDTKKRTDKPRKEPKTDYRREECTESFTCKICGTLVVPEGAGSRHRNHCPRCLSSIHVDNEPGDRASLCGCVMDPVSVWVRKNGEWAIIHRCRTCGTLSSNRIAADDNPALLMSIAVKPLATTPFPLSELDAVFS